jgi:hypothetical protein
MADAALRRARRVPDPEIATLEHDRGLVLATARTRMAEDAALLRHLIARLEPVAKGRRLTLALPALDSLASVARAQAAVVAAVCRGVIATDDGAALSALITAAGKAFDAAELERRVEGLERRITGSGRTVQ